MKQIYMCKNINILSFTGNTQNENDTSVVLRRVLRNVTIEYIGREDMLVYNNMSILLLLILIIIIFISIGCILTIRQRQVRLVVTHIYITCIFNSIKVIKCALNNILHIFLIFIKDNNDDENDELFQGHNGEIEGYNNEESTV
ncbi:exported protein, unknown function [Hepatocystis sp. ex Piliocolobus tephrosceles]|nr:exported protein, unknown function [Hepatocystis sp. ex Piliocolobus tephrosceles]